MSQQALIPAAQKLLGTFSTGATRSLDWRKRQLNSIVTMLEKRGPDFCKALNQDLGRGRMECEVLEVQQCITEAKEALKNLKSWAAPRAASVPLLQVKGLSKAYVEPRPKGVVLIIAPWNYPLILCVSPLISAIAAGNTVMVKPSELSASVSSTLTTAITEHLDDSAVAIAPGDSSVSTALLGEVADAVGGWAHIFFTGSGRVGRIVATAAARHLTPCTLELGGKSPVYVGSDANVDLAAKRVVWGKLTNNGQTCIAPDYVLCTSEHFDSFVSKARGYVEAFYGPDPRKSVDYGRIISTSHWKRLRDMVAQVEDVGGASGGSGNVQAKVVMGGVRTAGMAVEEERYLAPTIITIPAEVFTRGGSASERAKAAREALKETKVMQEEIFGPVLVVCSVPDIQTAAAFVNKGDTPLSTYVFGGRSTSDEWLGRVDSGGACVNEVLMHFATPSLPFGGVGESGYGMAHGVWGFDTFSHMRGTLDKAKVMDLSVRYPPYTDSAVGMIKKLV